MMRPLAGFRRRLFCAVYTELELQWIFCMVDEPGLASFIFKPTRILAWNSVEYYMARSFT